MDPKLIFPPVVEPNFPGAIITEHPRDVMTESSVKRQFLTGITYNEGLIKAVRKNMFHLYRNLVIVSRRTVCKIVFAYSGFLLRFAKPFFMMQFCIFFSALPFLFSLPQLFLFSISSLLQNSWFIRQTCCELGSCRTVHILLLPLQSVPSEFDYTQNHRILLSKQPH